MEKNLISIVIPAYNVANYIGKCIESLQKQTYQNIEIIVIDDGSKDNTNKLVKKYAEEDKRIQCISIPNDGVSNARNTGILKAKGKYILFVDSDDYVEHNLVEVLTSHIEEEIFSLCTYYRETIKGNKILKEEILWKKEKKQYVPKNDFLELYEAGLINSPYCKLYERDILLKKNIFFDKQIALGEDLLFNLNYIQYQRGFCYHNKPLYHYIKRQNESLSTKYRENMLEIQQTLASQMICFCKKELEWNENQQKKVYQIGLGYLLSSVSNEYKNKNRSMLKNYKIARNVLKDERIERYIRELEKDNRIEKRDANLLLKGNYLLYRLRKEQKCYKILKKK